MGKSVTIYYLHIKTTMLVISFFHISHEGFLFLYLKK